jgi:phosphoribosyl-ATP pyrophosphohydrolase
MKQSKLNNGENRMKLKIMVGIMVMCVGLCPQADAGVGAAVAKTVGKAATKVASKVGQEGAETVAEQGNRGLARQACRDLKEESVELCARYGDDAASYISRHGDDGVRFLQKFGDEGVEMVTRYGDDAAIVLAKHPGITTDLVRVGGDNAVQALKKLDPDAAIKLARESAELARKGQLDDVLKRVIAEPGPVTYERFKEILEIVLRNSLRIGGGVAIVAVGMNAADTIGAPADTMRAVTAVATNKLAELEPDMVADKWFGMIAKIILGSVAIVCFFLFLLLARIFPRRRRSRLKTTDRRLKTLECGELSPL